MTLALAQAATDAYYDANTILVPEDGDDLDAHQVEAALQRLSNRVQYGRGAVWGSLAWTGTLAVSGTAAAPVVLVGAIESCPLLATDNVWRPYYTSGETTLGASHVEGGGSLTGSTWYYVYAWSDAAAPTALKFQITTTPPTDASAATVPRLWKRDQAANFRYLGCFPTNTTGAPIPLRKTAGRVVYRRSGVASVEGLFSANGLRALSRSGAQASPTAVDLRPAVPPHSRVASLSLTAIGDSAPDTATLAIFTGTDTASGAAGVATLNDQQARLATDVEIAQAAQSITYTLTHAAAGTVTGYVDVLGFLE